MEKYTSKLSFRESSRLFVKLLLHFQPGDHALLSACNFYKKMTLFIASYGNCHVL